MAGRKRDKAISEDVAHDALVQVQDILRRQLLPEGLQHIGDEKLAVAYLLASGYTTEEAAAELGVPLHRLHAWLAFDDEVREAIDRFNEVKEQEIYTRTLALLQDLLGRQDLSTETVTALISMSIRMKQASDSRIEGRFRNKLRQEELELRWAALQRRHEPTFDWLEAQPSAADPDLFEVPDVSEQGTD